MVDARLARLFLVLFLAPLFLAPAAVRGDFRSGEAAYSRGDYADAYVQLLPEAKSGNGAAQYYLGQMYRKGRGVEVDLPEAFGWFSASNKSGFPWAEKQVAELRSLFNKGSTSRFALGDIVRADRLAGEYARDYSSNPDPDPRSGTVTVFSATGGPSYGNDEPCGTPPCNQPDEGDWDETIAAWKKRDYAGAYQGIVAEAEKGRPLAQGLLGEMFKMGLQVAQDNVKAHAWYDLAASQGLRWATTKRDEMSKNMTPGQVSQARALAREWAAEYNEQ